MKQQDKASVKNKQTTTTTAKTLMKQINNLPDKEFTIMVIKMLMNWREELMNTVRTSTERWKNIRKYESKSQELNNPITELKNTLLRFNRRLYEAEERINPLEDRAMEIIHSEQEKEKKNLKKCKHIKGLLEQHQTD